MNGVRLVIVVPCYNEEEVLKETTRQLSNVLARMEKEEKIAEGKILYVDDGSKDLTWSLIEQLSESDRYVGGLKLDTTSGISRRFGRDWSWWRAVIMTLPYLLMPICRTM